jgi:hypothetical protein
MRIPLFIPLAFLALCACDIEQKVMRFRTIKRKKEPFHPISTH